MPYFIATMIAIAIGCGILIATEPPDEASPLDRTAISGVWTK